MAKRNKKGELLASWEEIAEEQNELDDRAAKLADRSKGQYKRKKNHIVVEPAYPDERIGTFVRGLVLGALAGGAAMLFKAPRPGVESRAWLRSLLDDARATATGLVDEWRTAKGERDAWTADDEGSVWTQPPTSAEALTLATPPVAASPVAPAAPLAPVDTPPVAPTMPPSEAGTQAMAAVTAAEAETRAMPALTDEAAPPSPRPPGETIQPGSTMPERAEETEATPTTDVSHPGAVTPPPPAGTRPEEPAPPPDRVARD